MTKAAVQIKKVTKRIGKKVIVDGLSLDIQRGEVFGLLGPNGAGKTTTIRMIVGLMSITEGDILIHGKSIKKNFTEAISAIGAIVENPELYDFLSGYHNLLHYANMFPKASKARIEEVISIVGLENRIDEKVKTYSLGMRQRLGLAQALLNRPSVLILDEPTNGLDPAGIRDLRNYLRSLAQNEGVSVIVSSHLLSEMELMCDRFAIIQKGKLISIQNIGNYNIDKSDNIVLFDVDDPNRGKEEIEKAFPELNCQVENNFIEVITKREMINQINSLLVIRNIAVYGIQSKTKTLEDIFIEATGGGIID